MSSGGTADAGGTAGSTAGGAAGGAVPAGGGMPAEGGAAMGGGAGGSAGMAGGAPPSNGGASGGADSNGGKASGGENAMGGSGNEAGADSQAGAAGAAGMDGGMTCEFPTTFRWRSSGVLVSPKSDPSHNLVSVKDPTIVFFDSRYHVYATTANTAGNWNMVYFNFTDWSTAKDAPHYYMDRTPGFEGYHCAPHVFYFRPHKKWYLIQQSQPPQYSTNDDISQPDKWTRPQNFFAQMPAGTPELPIDYWVICDETHCYLFFTGDNGRLYRTRTRIEDFPNGFGSLSVALEESNRNDLFEGSATYKIKGTNKYLTIIEAIGANGRYYRAWTSDRLDGTWTPLGGKESNPFAGAVNVTYEPGVADWTNDVSHGELIRDGYDETMTIDPCRLELLYQGRDPASGGEYSQLPYRLGLLRFVRD